MGASPAGSAAVGVWHKKTLIPPWVLRWPKWMWAASRRLPDPHISTRTRWRSCRRSAWRETSRWLESKTAPMAAPKTTSSYPRSLVATSLFAPTGAEARRAKRVIGTIVTAVSARVIVVPLSFQTQPSTDIAESCRPLSGRAGSCPSDVVDSGAIRQRMVPSGYLYQLRTELKSFTVRTSPDAGRGGGGEAFSTFGYPLQPTRTCESKMRRRC